MALQPTGRLPIISPLENKSCVIENDNNSVNNLIFEKIEKLAKMLGENPDKWKQKLEDAECPTQQRTMCDRLHETCKVLNVSANDDADRGSDSKESDESSAGWWESPSGELCTPDTSSGGE